MASLDFKPVGKVIENIQRDINIALMNEFAKICHRIAVTPNAIVNINDVFDLRTLHRRNVEIH